jgi:hypothetical protein
VKDADRKKDPKVNFSSLDITREKYHMKDGDVRSANRLLIILVSYALSYFKWNLNPLLQLSRYPIVRKKG